MDVTTSSSRHVNITNQGCSVNTTDINGTKNYSDYEDYYEGEYDMLERAAYILSCPPYAIALTLGCTAILVNAISLAAIFQIRKSLTAHFRIVISLILSDLLVDITLIGYIISIVITPMIYRPGYGPWWPRAKSFCTFVGIKAFNTVGLNITLLNLMALAFEHYVAILMPFQLHTLLSKKRTLIMIVIMWLIALISGLSDFMSPVGELKEFQLWRHKFNFCEFIWLSNYQEEYITFAIALACCLAMLFMYLHIYCKVRGLDPHSTVARNVNIIRNKRAVITTIMILGTFMVCWLPLCMYNVTLLILTRLDETTVRNMIPVLETVDKYLYDLLLLNTLCDPIIYAIRVKQLRRGYWQLLYRCLPKSSRPMKWLAMRDARRASCATTTFDVNRKYSHPRPQDMIINLGQGEICFETVRKGTDMSVLAPLTT